MCTLIALHRCVTGARLAVAANRDEFLERSAEGPALRDTPHGIILAPRDRRAGGTWLGLNAAGLFAAVTNRIGTSPDPLRRSRGLLVVDVLGANRAGDAAERLECLATDAYNPVNLLIADGETAHAFTYAGAVERIDLQPGVHVIGNVPFGEATEKIERQRAQAEKAARAGANGVLDRLADLCREHAGEDPRSATCVHAGPYGTSSSTLLWLGDEPGAGELRYADGAPCESAYRDFTPLLRRLGLGRESGSTEGDSTERKIR